MRMRMRLEPGRPKKNEGRRERKEKGGRGWGERGEIQTRGWVGLALVFPEKRQSRSIIIILEGVKGRAGKQGSK